ncbi:hypothetical protein ABZZ36_09725 [Actinacidiphila glaucinigra]|uniref:hypothetical protein n=1 Tax=Actinacidiphila glaucinigra TaxID=235986 RepID=UPI0033B44384
MEPDALIVSKAQLPDIGCGTTGLANLRNASSDGKEERRGTTWWSMRSWRADRGCEISMAVFSYSGTGEAEEYFSRSSPRAVYSASWPEEPVEVSVPSGLDNDRSQILCVGGNPHSGCSIWIYWARYRDILINVEVFNLATQGIRVDQETFLDLVRRANARVVDGQATRRS